jgi:predicted HAD superfamily Cof-like phosphohydrolase
MHNTQTDKHVSVAADMTHMHRYYEADEAVLELDNEKLKSFLKFRFDFLQEELNEGREAIAAGNAEEIVDSLIDLVVVAVGTLDLYGVDFNRAWNEVFAANMNKKVGIKEGRENPYGLPDLVKGSDWVPPSHAGNHGLIGKMFSNES